MPKLTIEYAAHKTGNEHFAMISEGERCLVSALASSEQRVRESLRTEALRAMRAHAESNRHYRICVIGCADGTVLIAQWNHCAGEFEIRICGGVRELATVTRGSMPSYDKARADARDYARTMYGGILWENN